MSAKELTPTAFIFGDPERGIRYLEWQKDHPSYRGLLIKTPLFTQADIDAAVAAEREACAKACEARKRIHDPYNDLCAGIKEAEDAACAAAIRARGQA